MRAVMISPPLRYSGPYLDCLQGEFMKQYTVKAPEELCSRELSSSPLLLHPCRGRYPFHLAVYSVARLQDRSKIQTCGRRQSEPHWNESNYACASSQYGQSREVGGAVQPPTQRDVAK